MSVVVCVCCNEITVSDFLIIKINVLHLGLPSTALWACVLISSSFSYQLPSESSGLEDQGPVTSVDMIGAVHKDFLVDFQPPRSGSPEEVPELVLGSPTHQPEELQRASQASPSEQSPEVEEKPPGQATRSSQSPNKAFNSVIEHLSVVFPCYTRYE